MMKTVLCLGVLLLPAAASAYSHSVTNKTKTKIRFQVNYAACKNDTWELTPGEVRTFRSGACCINMIKASDAGIKSDKGVAKPIVACKNTNWVVTGGPNPKPKVAQVPGYPTAFTGGYSDLEIAGP